MQKRRELRRFRLPLFCLGTFLSLVGAAQGATFTVLNTNDSGADSLRAAITAANAAAGPHTITFNIPGAGPHVIPVLSPLPDLVQTMTVNGYSQPGSSANSNPVNLGLTTVLRIGLDGSAAGPADGLTLAAPDIAIRGLAIFGFAAAQIRVEQPRAVIAGNFLGTNIAGTADADGATSGLGVAIGGPAIPGGDDSVIGGTDVADRNLISGLGQGISIEGRVVTVRYNLIGTDLTGNAAIPNEDGIACQADDEVIEIDRNLVSGNNNVGILATSQGTGFCRLVRNYVGTNADGFLRLGNFIGIQVGPGSHVIGLPTVDLGTGGNLVGGNEDAGILISGAEGVRLGTNFIGAQPFVGSPDLGNGGPGIRVQASTNIQIGDFHPGSHTIRLNDGPGIEIAADSSRVSINNSTISDNGGLAIDLNADGITSNDLGDADSGANQGQNFPEITNVEIAGGVTTVSMELDGALSGTYRIWLYSNLSCDPSGYGEGEILRETVEVVADANGDASFATVIAAELTNEFISVIATNPNGDSSEFSTCGPSRIPVVEVPGLGSLGMLLLAAFLAVAGLFKLKA